MTVRELGARLGSDELSEWMAFESLYGLPDLYFATGQICATVAASMSDGKRPISAADFVPYFEAMRQRQTPGDMMARFAGLTKDGS